MSRTEFSRVHPHPFSPQVFFIGAIDHSRRQGVRLKTCLFVPERRRGQFPLRPRFRREDLFLLILERTVGSSRNRD